MFATLSIAIEQAAKLKDISATGLMVAHARQTIRTTNQLSPYATHKTVHKPAASLKATSVTGFRSIFC